MTATFLTLGKTKQFPVSFSLQTKAKPMFAAFTQPPKRQPLWMNYIISCSARISRNMKCSHQWLIVYFIIWSNQTTKHLGGVMLLKLCRILDHQRVTITKAQTPVSLLELMTCKCKMSGHQQNCSCSNTGLACTEWYFWMANDEGCGNPHGLTCVSDSEESNEESTFEDEL